MKLKLLKLGWKFSIFIQYYRWWSKLYRFLFQRKYVDYYMQYSDIDSLIEAMSVLSYRKDKAKELWDVCSHPGWVQFCIFDIQNQSILPIKQPDGPMDCDEFAIFAANAYENKAAFTYPLSIAYIKEDGKVSGHMVCVIHDLISNKYAHISNWGYFDGFDSRNDVINNVLGTKQLIGWCAWDKETLKPMKYSNSVSK